MSDDETFDIAENAGPFEIRRRVGRPIIVTSGGGTSEKYRCFQVIGEKAEVVEALAKKCEELRHAAGAYKTAQIDRTEVCKMGDILLSGNKQCYSAEAVTRAVIKLKADYERLLKALV